MKRSVDHVLLAMPRKTTKARFRRSHVTPIRQSLTESVAVLDGQADR
ncbi:MAG: hypothetical protein ACM3ML_03450 [Micromonosporaceae bacterium]